GRDERLEERAALALLRVPEDAEEEAATAVLDRLDDAVGCPRDRPEAAAEATEAPAMVGLDRRLGAEQPREPPTRVDTHVVVAEAGRVGLVLIGAEHLGQVLDEVAAEGDVDDLAAATDAEDGEIERMSGTRERHLRAIARRSHLVHLRMRVGVVLA